MIPDDLVSDHFMYTNLSSMVDTQSWCFIKLHDSFIKLHDSLVSVTVLSELSTYKQNKLHYCYNNYCIIRYFNVDSKESCLVPLQVW